jgi:hypothetical protein
MKRWMGLAVAILLLVAWNRSSADFLVIKIDVNKNYFAQQATPKQGGGVRPMAYQPLPERGGGSQLTAFQTPPGPGAGMYGPGKGFPGFPGGGGAYQGSGPSPGQFPGYGPGQFPGGMMGGQYMGGAGKSGGMPSFGPMMPNMGGGKDGPKYKDPYQGKFPNYGKQPNPMGWPGLKDENRPRWVYAYLELTHKPIPFGYFPKGSKRKVYTHIAIDHPWGKRCVVPLDLVKFPYTDEGFGYFIKDSMPTEFDKRVKKWAKDGDPGRLLNLAVWALEHGLLKQFHATMAKLEKMEKKPAQVVSALKKYAQMAEELRKAPAGDDPALAGLIADLKSKNYRALSSQQGHYSLWTNVASARNADLVRRLALMEETFEKFYYWFALHSSQETLLSVPGRRLLAVVVADPKEFAEKQKAWGNLPLVGDGFLPRRDNVMVLCAEHLDEAFALLQKNNQELVRKIPRSEFLSGSIWPGGDKKQLTPRDREVLKYAGAVALMQTMILVEKAVAEDAERATISHEAIRQLLFATGLLPRNVEVPEWIQYGLASFFETPEGAFYGGVGLPSWSNLIDFKYHRKKSKLGSAKDVLLNLVSDRYFLQARESAHRLDANRYRSENLANKAKDDQEIARSTAWALVYFLAKEGKLNTLLRYSAELDRLPRDLELSPNVLRSCFSRAFGLPDSRLQEIGNEWFTAMENTVLEIPEWERDFLNFRLEGANKAQMEASGGF